MALLRPSLLGASAIAVACATAPRPTAPVTCDRVRFTLRDPGAVSAAVTGSFNGWVAEPMTHVEDGTFELIVQLAPGAYRFTYRATRGDGSAHFEPPEGVRLEDDGFGSKNGVLYVCPDDGVRGNPPGVSSSLRAGEK